LQGGAAFQRKGQAREQQPVAAAAGQISGGKSAGAHRLRAIGQSNRHAKVARA